MKTVMPEKKPMRSVTECPELFVHVALGRYIRSPAQLNQIKSEAGKQRALYRVLKELCGRTKQQSAAKNFFRKNEVDELRRVAFLQGTVGCRPLPLQGGAGTGGDFSAES